MASARLLMPHGRRRRTRWLRSIRATLRDTMALWREFHWAIIAFVVATCGGGFLYGELWVRAGYSRLPFLDLPYIMLGLMVFQPHTDPLPNPELMAFWYVMPLVALLILGRGAADFARLFFDRSGRRNAWEEAVASTYRNHVIILGIGHVGLRVGRTLSGMGFDVVAIDQEGKPEIDDELGELGIPLIVGDGRLAQTLEKAGLRQAQSFIVCTSSDQMNLEVIMRVRDMNPDIRIVARMWDDQYTKQMQHFMGVQAVHSTSDLAAPIFAGSAVGIEITQTLMVDGEEYSMIRVEVEPGSFLEGATIGQLQSENDMDIVLHGHAGHFEVEPHHGLVVQGGDTLVMFARHDRIIDLVERNRRGTS
jgi:voltage-gated potassium channel